jgi:hypothetical protein
MLRRPKRSKNEVVAPKEEEKKEGRKKRRSISYSTGRKTIDVPCVR